jgi:ATP-dependent helicase/nuclease subunit A
VRHLLIDEFQDTNPLQWQALSSWLGSYAGAGSQAPSVFIVGDPKQSIYRFRRAEPQVFEAAQQFVATVLGGDRLSCDHTRRNAQQVIGVVNATLQAAVAAGAFNGFRTHTTDASAQGQVAVLPPIARATPDHAAAPDPDAGPAGWRDSLTQPREVAEETLRTREARQVAAWIVQCLQAGWQPGELMVLSRRRVGLQPMQQALRALGIPAQIGEKTALGDCCEVQDIVALLDALVSPHHDLSLARALKSPLFGLDDAALVALRLRGAERALSWFDRLQLDWPADSPLAGLGAQLQRWRVLVRSLPPHDALQAIYTEADVLARFAAAAPADQRSAVLANLRALPEASLQLAGGRYATPYALVRALKAGGVQAPAARLDNAVRLLTVHGAKGLEARGVVLLDTDTPERPGDTMGVLVDWPGQAAHPRQLVFLASETAPPPGVAALLAHEQTQRRREELNALYVAMTRARETLLLSAIEPHRDASGSWWRRLGALNLPMLEAPETAGPARVAGEGEAVVYLPALPDWVPPARPELPPEDSPAARLGKAMHRLLEWGDLTPQRAGLAAREFRLSATQSAQALDMARRIRSGAGAWVWDPAILDWQGSEVELAVDGQLQRIDRLVRRRDTGAWWVLDYKSAAEPQRQPALVAQLQAYRRAVAGLAGGAPVHAAFLSADGAQIDLPPDP